MRCSRSSGSWEAGIPEGWVSFYGVCLDAYNSASWPWFCLPWSMTWGAVWLRPAEAAALCRIWSCCPRSPYNSTPEDLILCLGPRPCSCRYVWVRGVITLPGTPSRWSRTAGSPQRRPCRSWAQTSPPSSQILAVWRQGDSGCRPESSALQGHAHRFPWSSDQCPRTTTCLWCHTPIRYPALLCCMTWIWYRTSLVLRCPIVEASLSSRPKLWLSFCSQCRNVHQTETPMHHPLAHWVFPPSRHHCPQLTKTSVDSHTVFDACNQEKRLQHTSQSRMKTNPDCYG